MEFTYYAGNGLTYNGMAVCSVDGGPDYDVPITGSSHTVNFKLSTNSLDYGEVPYTEVVPKDFYIENVGRVPFEFNINLGPLSRQGVIECSTMTGKVLAHERFKITVKFYPGIPDNIKEMFLVECGHFPAEKFTVKAVGIYPACLLSFPRSEETLFGNKFDVIRQKLESRQIQYSALFQGDEAVKNMPPVPPKQQENAIRDPKAMEIEAEVDRQMLCDTIVDHFNLGMSQSIL